jgi:hypothetical protein
MQGGDDDPGTALNSKFEFDNQSMMDPEVEWYSWSWCFSKYVRKVGRHRIEVHFKTVVEQRELEAINELSERIIHVNLTYDWEMKQNGQLVQWIQNRRTCLYKDIIWMMRILEWNFIWF